MNIQRVMRFSLPLILTSMLLTGFNSSAIAQQKLFSAHYPIQSRQNYFSQAMTQDNIVTKLLTQYYNWKNVRYRFGGTTRKGIDCSAFVQTTYKEQFGIHLPRTTLLQRNIGKRVSKNNLQAGDLIFFNIKSGVRHIGIYIGNNQFMHSGSSHGVSISYLNNTYWTKRFSEVRRVLTNQSAI